MAKPVKDLEVEVIALVGLSNIQVGPVQHVVGESVDGRALLPPVLSVVVQVEMARVEDFPAKEPGVAGRDDVVVTVRDAEGDDATMLDEDEKACGGQRLDGTPEIGSPQRTLVP